MQQPISADETFVRRIPEDAGRERSRGGKAAQSGKRAVRLLAQLALIVAVYAAGCALATMLPIALPGNILGMVLLLVLLGTGLLKAKHIGDACDCLIDNMSLFFIPASVAIMGSMALLEGNVLKFVLVCIVTTVLVFLATAYTVVLVSRLMARGKAVACEAEVGSCPLADKEA
ncbi:MAG: CidA/LrgA family protein [Gordonibacter sp.]|uniref:CidA/LrgA family protein n=1 Tax=Gordonibacter sp. TaxID=1968902 RepID=UPI00321F7450